MKIIIHHTATSRDKTKVTSIDNNHKKRWNKRSQLGSYIGYHFLILGSGDVFQARKVGEEGMHTVGYNNDIGICLTGNFEKESPSKEQLSSLWQTIKRLENDFSIDGIFLHKDFSRTLCPGKNLEKKVAVWKKIRIVKKMINNLKRKIWLLKNMI
jgi:N-acetylmuramoyl-L-alanine amidase